MTVELISVGTEILLGNIVNTNAAYLAERCALLGLSCYHQSVVGDNEERLEEELRRALSRSDIVILSGGLGPTKDDLTKEVTAKVFGRELREDPHTRERIQEYFDRSGRKLTANNWNVVQYSVLTMMMAQVSGLKPGEFVHVIADAHIYDRHVPVVEEIIARKPYDAPALWIDPAVTDFYAFTTDSLRLEGYEAWSLAEKIPVAV